MTEDLQLPSMSRSSSDRSDSSIGGQKPVDKVDTKMFGSNLYWEEEILEASLIGGSEPGLLDPPQWDLDMKNASATLDLELSMDLAKKLLRVDPAMGLEGPQNVAFDSTFPPPGGVSGSILQTRCSNPRYVFHLTLSLFLCSNISSQSDSRPKSAVTSRRKEAACTESSVSLLTASTNSG